MVVGLALFLFGCQSSSNYNPSNSYESKDYIESEMVLKCHNIEKQVTNEFNYYKIDQRATSGRVDLLGVYERKFSDWKPWCQHTLRTGDNSYICDFPIQDNGQVQKNIIDLRKKKLSWLVFENNKLVFDPHAGCGVEDYNIN